MLADYHLHTAFSDDSVTPMEDMVQRALALGFDEICFTEHVYYGVMTDL
ncbi:MAG: PHP domain-containing protein, partial [Eubacteriales bacterium]|nr:PHP domain-containing protein [Eubacteriales bacterium]